MSTLTNDRETTSPLLTPDPRSLIPDYLVIGHICADLQPDGTTRLGGTALFAALAAHRLGLRAAIVTACAPDLDLGALPATLPVLRQPAPTTTIFENRYTPQGRIQRLHGRAATIDLGAAGAALPAAWRSAPIVHLAPVMQEVPPDAAALFGGAIVGVTPQGWLRGVAEDRLVTTDPPALLWRSWVGVRAVIFSEEDIQGDEHLARQLAADVPLVVLTRAERGATIFTEGQPADVAALPAQVADPTGAGDVFAAAFLAALWRGAAPVAATRWACAAAACAIEGPGTATLPTTAEVEARLASGDA